MSIPEQQMQSIMEGSEYLQEQYYKELNSIDESIRHIKTRRVENQDMQNSINTDSENYQGSSDESCFKMHETIIFRCEIIENQLKKLKFYKEKNGRCI